MICRSPCDDGFPRTLRISSATPSTMPGRPTGASEPDRVEEIAHRVAWAAVKKRYRKVGSSWVPREFALGAVKTP